MSRSSDERARRLWRRIGAGRYTLGVPPPRAPEREIGGYEHRFGEALSDRRMRADGQLAELGMRRMEIPRSLEEALGPERADELRCMVDERRILYKKSSLSTGGLRCIETNSLLAGAQLDRKVSKELLDIENHHWEICAELGRARPGRKRRDLESELRAAEREIDRLLTEPGNSRRWMDEHAQQWVSGYSAACVCFDRRLAEAQREQRQGPPTEVSAFRFGEAFSDRRIRADSQLAELGMRRMEIPLSLEEALGPGRAEELRCMVDEQRILYRKSSLSTDDLRDIERNSLLAGAQLDRKVSSELLRIENHQWRICAELGRDGPGRKRSDLESELRADEREIARLLTEPGNSRRWMDEHAQQWVSGYAAACECFDSRLAEAQRERHQAVSTELSAGSTVLELGASSALQEVGAGL